MVWKDGITYLFNEMWVTEDFWTSLKESKGQVSTKKIYANKFQTVRQITRIREAVFSRIKEIPTEQMK